MRYGKLLSHSIIMTFWWTWLGVQRRARADSQILFYVAFFSVFVRVWYHVAQDFSKKKSDRMRREEFSRIYYYSL
jgi:hypothetical protein